MRNTIRTRLSVNSTRRYRSVTINSPDLRPQVTIIVTYNDLRKPLLDYFLLIFFLHDECRSDRTLVCDALYGQWRQFLVELILTIVCAKR